MEKLFLNSSVSDDLPFVLWYATKGKGNGDLKKGTG